MRPGAPPTTAWGVGAPLTAMQSSGVPLAVARGIRSSLVVVQPDLSRTVRDPVVEKDNGDLGFMGAPPVAMLGSGASSAVPLPNLLRTVQDPRPMVTSIDSSGAHLVVYDIGMEGAAAWLA